MNLCQGKFRLDIRKMFVTQRVGGHWLPREVVTNPWLLQFKEHLDMLPEVWQPWWDCWGCPVQDQELNLMILVGPF